MPAPSNSYYEITYQTYQSVSGQATNMTQTTVLIASPDLPGAIRILTSNGVDPSRIINCQARQVTILS